MDDRSKVDGERKAREGRVKWLLSRIATCDVCGKYMEGSAARGMYTGECGHVAIKASDLDEFVTEVVLKLLASPELYRSLRQAGQESDAAVLAARTEVARLQARLEDARTAWKADRLSLDSFIEFEADLKPKIRRAQDQLSQVTVPPVLRNLIDSETDVVARWAVMDLSARRDVIKALMVIKVNRSKMVDGGWLWPEDRVEITPR